MKLTKFKNFELSNHSLLKLFDSFSKIFLRRKVDLLIGTETDFITSSSIKVLIQKINEFKKTHNVIKISDISDTPDGIDRIYLCRIQYLPN